MLKKRIIQLSFVFMFCTIAGLAWLNWTLSTNRLVVENESGQTISIRAYSMVWQVPAGSRQEYRFSSEARDGSFRIEMGDQLLSASEGYFTSNFGSCHSIKIDHDHSVTYMSGVHGFSGCDFEN